MESAPHVGVRPITDTDSGYYPVLIHEWVTPLIIFCWGPTIRQHMRNVSRPGAIGFPSRRIRIPTRCAPVSPKFGMEIDIFHLYFLQQCSTLARIPESWTDTLPVTWHSQVHKHAEHWEFTLLYGASRQKRCGTNSHTHQAIYGTRQR